MGRIHRYTATISWTGNRGQGTVDYKSYDRDHHISIADKPVIEASADSHYRGNPSKHTPEDLLISSLSGCHMLWYLHLCAVNGVVVSGYEDHAQGMMEENDDGSGQFTEVILHPQVTVTEDAMIEKAHALHENANRMCFVARSVNFPIRHVPEISVYEKA